MGLAADELARLLPDGPTTAGHVLRSVVTSDGVVVGSIWVGPKGPDDHDVCFVWDIHIEPEARGQGYGRAAMLALEDLARSMGSRTIELHVFGDNTVARGLYRSLGFVETDVQMRLDLGSRPLGSGRRARVSRRHRDEIGSDRPGRTGA